MAATRAKAKAPTRRRTRAAGANINARALKRLQGMDERNPLEDFLAKMLIVDQNSRLPVFRVSKALQAFNIDYSRGMKTSQILQSLGFRNQKLVRSNSKEDFTYPCLIGVDFVRFGDTVDMELMDIGEDENDRPPWED